SVALAFLDRDHERARRVRHQRVAHHIEHDEAELVALVRGAVRQLVDVLRGDVDPLDVQITDRLVAAVRVVNLDAQIAGRLFGVVPPGPSGAFWRFAARFLSAAPPTESALLVCVFSEVTETFPKSSTRSGT